MAWWNPFKKTAQMPPPCAPDHKSRVHAAPAAPIIAPPPPPPPQETASAEEKGMLGKFYRMWKNPAFLSQIKALSAHMAKDGVNIKDRAAVKAWLEKNKEAIEKGQFKEPPQEAAKPQTFVKTGPDVGRNDPCPCGSGKKYKKCCQAKV